MAEKPHLEAEERCQVDGLERDFRNAERANTAAEAIGRLPGPRQALHLIIPGRFALWDCVPAILQLAAPARLDALHMATLGFSRSNIDQLAALLDAGQIGRAWLLASHYFKGTSSEIYEQAQKELGRRPTARFLSLRTHAKLMAIALDDGRKLSIESSANLRSCHNIEQITIIGAPALYRFHAGWIDRLFQADAGRSVSQGSAGAHPTTGDRRGEGRQERPRRRAAGNVRR